MSDLSQLSDAELMALAQQHLQTPSAPAPAAQKSPLGNVWEGFKGAFKGAGDVLSVPEHAAYQAGGKVTDLTGSPEAGYVANLGIQGGAALSGGLLKPGAQAVRGAAEWLMQKAAKPSTADLLSGKGARAVGTMLDEGINATPGGMQKLRGMGNEANQQAAELIAPSTAMINKNAVASRLGDVEKKFQAQVNPQSDLNAIQDADTAFLTHPDLVGQSSMPIQLAQRLKSGTYAQLGDKAYGEVGTASTAAQKALARGLKEEIETAIPEVAPINARASDIWNAHNVVNRRALVAGNRDVIGMAPFAHDPAGMLAFLMGRSPLAQSLAARLINNSQRVPGTVAGTALGAQMGIPDNPDQKRAAAMAALLQGQSQ